MITMSEWGLYLLKYYDQSLETALRLTREARIYNSVTSTEKPEILKS